MSGAAASMCHLPRVPGPQIALIETFVPGAYYHNRGYEASAEGRYLSSFGWHTAGHLEAIGTVATASVGGIVAGTARTTTGAVRVTAKGIARVEQHLGSLGALDDPPNQAMLQRLRDGLTTQHEISFYLHELKESAFMRRGVGYDAAHQGTLRWQGIPYNAATPASLYHPDVVRQFSEFFNRAAWPQ